MKINENISLIEFAEKYPRLTITVECSDLFEAFKSILAEVKHSNDNDSKLIEDERLLTENEVQHILQVSHCTLWRWNKDGYLSHINIGRKNRYRYTDIMRIKNNK